MGRSRNRRGFSKKPTGAIKGLNIQNSPSGMPIVGEMRLFKFPEDKAAAEEVAMKGLMDSLLGGYVPYYFTSYSRHPTEEGPDFNVIWNETDAFVELTELAPLNGPYSTARRVFTVNELADLLEKVVLKKQAIYLDRPHRPIFLLIYVTDDAFYVTEEVLIVLAHLLKCRSDLIFEAVFFLAFWDDGRPHIKMPYPHPYEIRYSDINHLLTQQVINLDISKTRVIEQDPSTNSIVIRHYLPEGADINKLADSIKALLPGLDSFLNKRDEIK